jgi:hypothetical protein
VYSTGHVRRKGELREWQQFQTRQEHTQTQSTTDVQNWRFWQNEASWITQTLSQCVVPYFCFPYGFSWPDVRRIFLYLYFTFTVGDVYNQTNYPLKQSRYYTTSRHDQSHPHYMVRVSHNSQHKFRLWIFELILPVVCRLFSLSEVLLNWLHHHHHHHLLLSLMGVNKTSPSGPISGHPLHLAPALPFF